jgi:membrane-associated phospholipid phosphatase
MSNTNRDFGSVTEFQQPHPARRTHIFLVPQPQSHLAQALEEHPSSNVGALLAAEVIGAFIVSGAILVGLGMLLTHVLEHGALGRWDQHVITWFVAHGTTMANSISNILTWMANAVTVAVIIAVVTVVLWLRKWGAQSFLLVVGIAIELTTFLTVNSLVGRPRPTVRHLGGTPSTYSYPSGHVAAAIVLYGGLAVLVIAATQRWWPRAIAVFLAAIIVVGVGLSRIYRGEHYPTDVFAGALLGVMALMSAVLAIRICCAHSLETSTAVNGRGGNWHIDQRAKKASQ